MGISLIGLLLTDFNFIFVILFPNHAPGGYWFLLFGPLLEGALGGTSYVCAQYLRIGHLLSGFTGASAAIHAYQADVTNDHNRFV